MVCFHCAIAIRTRIIGIDTAEVSTEKGRHARDWLRETLPIGTKTVIETSKDSGDKYGRWLAKVALPDGKDLSSTLLENKLALPYDGGKKTPQTD